MQSKFNPGRVLFGVITLILIGHIIIGSSVFITAVAIFAVLIGFSGIIRYGTMDLAALMLLVIAFRYVGFPLLAKLILQQPLQSNLETPLKSFVVDAAGVLGYWLAFSWAHRIRVGKPLLQPSTNPRFLYRTSLWSYVIGTAASAIVGVQAYAQRTPTMTASFLGNFTDFLFLSFLCALEGYSLAAPESHGRRKLAMLSFLIVTTVVLFSLAENSRAVFVNMFLAYLLGYYAFTAQRSLKRVALIAGIALAVLVVATPVYLAVRAVRSDLSLPDRINLTMNLLKSSSNVNIEDISSAYEAINKEQTFFSYYGPGLGNLVDRVSFVYDTDMMISGADHTHKIGFSIFRQAFSRVLPRIFESSKPFDYGEGDWIYNRIGIPILYGNFITAPLIGVSYSAFGWWGVFILPMLVTIPLVLMVKKISGLGLRNNVWSIFFFIIMMNPLVEGGLNSYLVFLLRTLPQYLILITGIIHLSRIRLRE